MPFQSEAQRRFMYSQHPDIAARWSKEYPDQGKLPEHVAKKKRRFKNRKELEDYASRLFSQRDTAALVK
jgi:hypothetical protein